MIVPGQFDDAASSDDDAVSEAPRRCMSVVTPQRRPVAPKATPSPPPHVQIQRDSNDKDDWNENDDENDDEYDFMEEDDGCIATTTTVSHKVANRLQQMQDLECTQRTLHTDRNDRSTLEQVLDPRTRYILFKLLQSNVLSKLEGCLSTGKEANVYYALAGAQTFEGAEAITEYALKVYKTSILIFRDRDKYVSGEYRYRNGYCKSNPRKMIALWAEKELRNYRRIHQAGIPCPRPLAIQRHVLVLEFLGSHGWPAPRLKDLPTLQHPSRYLELYRQSLLLLRHMYQRCQLVHGDYSEYNLLYHNERLYVIDVSQSVEQQHPAAYDFLRLDIRNISDYFAKQLPACEYPLLTTRQAFDFIVNDKDTVGSEEEEERRFLDRLLLEQRVSPAPEDPMFLQTYLPRNLHEIQLPSSERACRSDASVATNDPTSYQEQAVAHMVSTTTTTTAELSLEMEASSPAVEDADSSSSSEDDDENGPRLTSRKTPDELLLERQLRKDERRRNKKLVKEEQSRKRQEKKKRKGKSA